MIGRVAVAGLWAAAALLLALAADLWDPMLSVTRPWLAPALVAAGVAVALAVVRRARRGIGAWALAAAWLAVAGMVGGQLVRMDQARRTVLAAGPEAAAIGRHFVVGYARVDDILPLVRRGLVGGVFVTHRNVAGRSAAAVAAEIRLLQQARRDAGLPPLIVAADQEGGIVSRLSPPLTALPPLATLAGLAPAERAAAATAYGGRQGRELAGLGITMDLAPVVDLRADGPANPLDRNSLIAQRAIADDPDVVAAVAEAYGRGLEAAGVRPTLKHFPGLGRIRADTHWFGAHLDGPDERGWLPFREVAAHSGAAVMIGHVVVDALDPAGFAWQSERVVQGVVRRGCGFQGLLITDDLTMEPPYHAGLCRSVVSALNAGVDLLLIAYDGIQAYPALDCALRAWRTGRLDGARLAESNARLAR